MARGLAERLKLSGFAVDIEFDGASAAQTALLEPYSLIILDINLPNVSGFEVLHKIRQERSTVPVMNSDCPLCGRRQGQRPRSRRRRLSL